MPVSRTALTLFAAVVALASMTACAVPRSEAPLDVSSPAADEAAVAPTIVSAPAVPDDPRRPVRGIVVAVDNDKGVCVVSVGMYAGVIRGLRFFVSRDGVDIATVTLDWIALSCTAALIRSADTPIRVGDVVRGPSGRLLDSNVPGLDFVETSDGSAPEQMSPWPRVRARVLAADDSVCFLEAGTREGVQLGEEFTISRDSHFVAMATVEHVDRDVSLAVIQPGTGALTAQKGDDARSDCKPVTDYGPIGSAK